MLASTSKISYQYAQDSNTVKGGSVELSALLDQQKLFISFVTYYLSDLGLFISAIIVAVGMNPSICSVTSSASNP